ncbi:MAG: hypothetical protein OIF32_10405 [Campylobacterales bacterium]|nr:hypothetical protein [Campylobacterales bacterium]
MGQLFYKEWLKIKTIYIVFALVIIVSLAQIYTGISNGINYTSPSNYIYKILFYESFNFYGLFYGNLLLGLGVGLFQFYKERDKGRVRLHIHLPYSYQYNITSMVISGVLLICVTFLIEAGIFLLITLPSIPKELVEPLFLKVFCSFINGLIVYLATPALLIEPNKIKNVGNILLTILIILTSITVNTSFYSSENFWNFYLLALIFEISALYLSFYRYTKGYIK